MDEPSKLYEVNRTKRARKGEYSLSLSPPTLQLLRLGHSQTETCTTGSPGSQAFRLQLELHHQLPWSPACWLQTVGLLSLYDDMSQFLITNHIGRGA